MKLRQIPTISILLAVSLSCSSPNESSQGQSNAIVGWWYWLLSDGSEVGVRTPESEGYTIIYRFEANNIFYEFRNDTLALQSFYRIARDKITPFMPDSSDVLTVDAWTVKWMVEYSGTDSLTLRALAFDVGYSRFVRRR